ncbi:MAG: phage tail length tape measure family protein [Sulfuritalea sp.]|nr:phage tail length tape measure family protein [Sulfuritalea sp.]
MSSDIQFGLKVSYDGKSVAAGATANAEQIKAIGATAEAAGAKASRALDYTAMSAKQTAFALRGVPAQFTDIVTAIASGQNPMMVMVQQGGQLKDMFGGVGPAARALGGYIAGLANPFTIAAAAAAAAGYAIYYSVNLGKEPVKELKTALGDLASEVGAVGKTAREFSMDNVYKEFNKASAGARAGIVDHVRFQQTLLETQGMLARQSLSKSMEGLGTFGLTDKLKGAFGDSQAEKLARELGVSVAAAKDMLPAIKGLRDGTEDAANFMGRFGGELAKSGKGAAQRLIVDITAVANGSRDAAAAQTKLSEALKKMSDAGAGGTIALPAKGHGALRDGLDDAAREQAKSYAQQYEAAVKLARGIEAEEAAGRKLLPVEALLITARDTLTEAQMRELEQALAGAAVIEQRRKAEKGAADQAKIYTDALRAQIAPLEDRMRLLAAERENYGKTEAEINALAIARLEEARAIAAANGAMAQHLDFYDREIAARQALGDELKRQKEAQADWLAGAKAGLDDYARTVEDKAGQTRRAWSSTWKRAEDDLSSALAGGKASISDFVRYAAAEFARISIVQPAMKGLGGAASGLLEKLMDGVLNPSVGNGGLPYIDALGGAFAKGGTFNSPDLHRYVNTVVARPTPFRFAKGGALGEMGEAGPEAIMPLKRGKDGSLGVAVQGGTGTTPVTFNTSISIDARGAGVGVGPIIERAMEMAVAQAKSEVLRDLEGGGRFAYATGRRR